MPMVAPVAARSSPDWFRENPVTEVITIKELVTLGGLNHPGLNPSWVEPKPVITPVGFVDIDSFL